MRSVAIIPVFREAGKVGRVLERFEPGSVDQICLVLDNPDDQITSEIEESIGRSKVPVSIIKNPERKGIGYAIREGYEYALSQLQSDNRHGRQREGRSERDYETH